MSDYILIFPCPIPTCGLSFLSLSFLSTSGPGQEPAITAAAVDALGSDGKGLACRVVGAPPGGAKFKAPVTVRVPLDASKAPPGAELSALYKPDDSSPWGPLPTGVTVKRSIDGQTARVRGVAHLDRTCIIQAWSLRSLA